MPKGIVGRHGLLLFDRSLRVPARRKEKHQIQEFTIFPSIMLKHRDLLPTVVCLLACVVLF